MVVNVFIVKAKSSQNGDQVMAITMTLPDAARRCEWILEASEYTAEKLIIDEYPVCGQMNFSLNQGGLEVSTMKPVQTFDFSGNPLTKRTSHYS